MPWKKYDALRAMEKIALRDEKKELHIRVRKIRSKFKKKKGTRRKLTAIDQIRNAYMREHHLKSTTRAEEFMFAHEKPPTRMAKAHHARVAAKHSAHHVHVHKHG